MSKRAEARRQQARLDKKFEETLRTQFKNVQQQGIAAGAYAMCKVVIEKAEADKPAEDRLNDIVEFCNVMIKDTVVKVNTVTTDASEEQKDEV